MNDDVREALPAESSDVMTSEVETRDSTEQTREAPTKRPGKPWLGALIGAVTGAVGLLPWVVTGMRLPLPAQNLWAGRAQANEMPIALLPFSQHELIFVMALLVTTPAVAGLVSRASRGRAGRLSAWAIFLGLIVVQIAAVVQTFVVTQHGLEESNSATIYLELVTGVAVLALLSGVVVFWLVARAPRAGALIGFAVASVAVVTWLGALMEPFRNFEQGAATEFDMRIEQLAHWVEWVPAVLIGLAIGWCGIRSVGRVVAVLVSLVLLWLTPAFVVAVTYATDVRLVTVDLPDMADAGWAVFRTVATQWEFVYRPLVVSVGVAVLAGVMGLAVRGLTSSGEREPAES